MLQKEITLENACEIIVRETGGTIAAIADIGDMWTFNLMGSDGRIIPSGITIPAVTKTGEYTSILVWAPRTGKQVEIPAAYRTDVQPWLDTPNEKVLV